MYLTKNQLLEKAGLKELQEVHVCVPSNTDGLETYWAIKHYITDVHMAAKYEMRCELSLKTWDSELYCVLPTRDYKILFGTPTEKHLKSTTPTPENITILTAPEHWDDIARINNAFYDKYVFSYECPGTETPSL